MKKIYLPVLIFLSVISSRLYSQELNGKITDPATALPLTGVSVVAPGSKGAVTNAEGAYSIRLSGGTVKVTFSSVGYESKTIDVALSAGETKELNIELVAATSSLEQVIVTGSRTVGRTKLESPVPV